MPKAILFSIESFSSLSHAYVSLLVQLWKSYRTESNVSYNNVKGSRYNVP